MSKYQVRTNSFAAPFCSDTDTKSVEADNPQDALVKAVTEYGHPFGLYAAKVKVSDKESLAWLSLHALALEKVTQGKDGYTVRSDEPGEFTVDDNPLLDPQPLQRPYCEVR